MTVAAENDVIIQGNLQHNASTVIGLIANGFVRVYHPVQYSNGDCDTNRRTSRLTRARAMASATSRTRPSRRRSWRSTTRSGSTTTAAATPLGTLNVTRRHRPEVQGHGGHAQRRDAPRTGYLKGYNYDSALKYHQPPYFLDPVQASWDIQSETEQVPAH